MEESKIKKSIKLKDYIDLGALMYRYPNLARQYQKELKPMRKDIIIYWKNLVNNWKKDPFFSKEDLHEKAEIYRYLRNFRF
jgi:hypothetical protein